MNVVLSIHTFSSVPFFLSSTLGHAVAFRAYPLPPAILCWVWNSLLSLDNRKRILHLTARVYFYTTE